MNAFEIKVFSERMQAMTIEEKEMAAKYIPDEIMFSELERRSIKRREVIKIMEESLKISKERR